MKSAKLGSSYVIVLCVAFATSDSAAKAASPSTEFNRDIRPILADKCFRCHGPDSKTREAGLRLDVRAAATAPAESGETAIVPGKPTSSVLIARINSADEFERMPPAELGKPLNENEKQLLEHWIQEGAKYQEHWSFVTPKRPAEPDVSDPDWIRNPIDRFVLARLDREGLKPSPPADPHALLRRVSLDLTGLPPSLDEVDSFVASPTDAAYENAVQRLLGEQAYGERWAQVWLDLARYADSAGYAQDPPRTIWRYRDWVIQAINKGMPFDQFTLEQIAGDMLPNATKDQIVATAFHRNTMTNSEGGTDDEEFRNAAVVDRVNTTMQVWMGLTMGCAQCHDHKYDPISQEEFFRFLAVFNNTEDADRGNESPTLATYSHDQEQQQEKLRAEIAAIEREAESAVPEDQKGPTTGPLATRFVRVELPGQGKFLSLAEVQVFVGDKNVALSGAASQISTGFDGPAKLAIDGNTNGDYFVAKSTTHTQSETNPWWEVDLGRAATVDRISLWNRTDGGVGTRLAGFRIVLMDSTHKPLWVGSIAPPPQPSVEVTPPKAAEKISDTDRKALLAYAGSAPKSSAQQKKLAELKKKLAAIKPITTPIMRELPEGRRRKTNVQLRGNFLVKGDEVTAGVPSTLHPLPDGVEANRLAIARWLVAEDNPLTARVIVNRFWEQLFGRGLVETSEDFGVQGVLPLHPELLDFLAVEFMRHDWDTKWLVHTIVTSATYRQTSRATKQLLERDRDNRLLARGPRFRLPAEMIRDQALEVSGLLSHKMYGPSVQPPRPALGLRAAFGGSTDWKTSAGEDKYRRGLYTSWRRTTPYPSMTTFDAPSREVCTIRRIRTNTPLQALVTMNDPVFVEAAQALARRIMTEGGDKVKDRASYGFRLCLARPPKDNEIQRLEQLYEEALTKLGANGEEARLLATDPRGPAPANLDVTELAAWTVVANVLFNLDEFLARQ